MDTLRILQTCERSSMNRLIALLLLAPALASANTELFGTSGSMTLKATDDNTTFAVAGNGFSASGDFVWFAGETNPIRNNPFPPGPYSLMVADNLDETLSMGLTVNGVPWAAPLPPPGGPPAGEGSAFAGFITSEIGITHPGTYSTSFAFTGSLLGLPVASVDQGFDCSTMTCKGWDISGGGIVTLDAVLDPNFPGSLEISEAKFTFKAPEPSTASLLLFGFAGLAVLGLLRSCRAKFILVG